MTKRAPGVTLTRRSIGGLPKIHRPWVTSPWMGHCGHARFSTPPRKQATSAPGPCGFHWCVHVKPCPLPAAALVIMLYRIFKVRRGANERRPSWYSRAGPARAHRCAGGRPSCRSDRPGKRVAAPGSVFPSVPLLTPQSEKCAFVLSMASGHRPGGDTPNGCVATHTRLLGGVKYVNCAYKTKCAHLSRGWISPETNLGNGGAKFADRLRFPDSAVCAVIRNAGFLGRAAFFTWSCGDWRRPPCQNRRWARLLRAISALSGQADGQRKRQQQRATNHRRYDATLDHGSSGTLRRKWLVAPQSTSTETGAAHKRTW